MLKALYIDDDKGDQERFKYYIEQALKALNWTHNPIVDVKDFDGGFSIAQNVPNDYSLIIIDILEKRVGKKEKLSVGLNLIKKASDSDHWAIVGISDDANYRDEAIESGAYEFIGKESISTSGSGIEKLKKILLKSLEHKEIDRKFKKDIPIEYERNDIVLHADIKMIGASTLGLLAGKVLKKICWKVILFSSQPGLSGAKVFKSQCFLGNSEDENEGTKMLFLKVQKDSHALLREYQKNETAKMVFPNDLFVSPIATPPIETETVGWYALGYDLQGSAETLRSWVKNQNVKDKIDRIFKLLFYEKSLSDSYKNTKAKCKDSAFKSLSNLLRFGRDARIKLSHDELAPLLNHFLKINPDLDILTSFLLANRFGDIDEAILPKESILVKCHGDLHGGNILVDTKKEIPRLIDPANIDNYHWSCDFARLIVDLTVSCFDAGIESHKWENVKSWWKLAEQLIQGEDLILLDSDRTNFGTVAALSWLSKEKENVFRSASIDFSLWQFQLGLAYEFLRASYRVQELTVQKRSFALLAGLDAVRIASRTFKKK